MSQDSHAVEVARRHARATVSFQTLGWQLQRRFYGDDAYVAYAEHGNCWTVPGGPIAPKEREQEVLERFVSDARAQGKRVRIFAIEDDISASASFTATHLGDQPVWDPAQWPAGLSKRLRGQIRRARAKGNVTTRLASVSELSDRRHPTRRGIESVVQEWLDTRPMPPLEFVLRVDLFSVLEERRIFVAESAGQVVGVLVALPIYGRNGWFIESTIRGKEAPNGTMDMLFDCAMYSFAAEGSRRVTLGITPLAGVSSPALRVMRDLSSSVYNFKGLHTFKAKLGPQSWEPVYLAHPKDESPTLAVVGLFSAFMRGQWLRYAWDCFRHCADWTARWCAKLLVPWIAALAFVGADWFPSTGARLGWLALYAALFGGLFALGARWRRWLAVLTAGGYLLAAVLAAFQIATYNAARADGADWFWLALGTLIPLLMAAFLWDSRNRLTMYLQLSGQQQVAPETAGRERWDPVRQA